MNPIPLMRIIYIEQLRVKVLKWQMIIFQGLFRVCSRTKPVILRVVEMIHLKSQLPHTTLHLIRAFLLLIACVILYILFLILFSLCTLIIKYLVCILQGLSIGQSQSISPIPMLAETNSGAFEVLRKSGVNRKVYSIDPLGGGRDSGDQMASLRMSMWILIIAYIAQLFGFLALIFS